MKRPFHSKLCVYEIVLLWLSLVLWLAVFLVGTLVGSAPYRTRFASFEGGVWATIGNGLLVVLTYTLTNVGLLCVLAGVLGVLGRKAVLDCDAEPEEQAGQDAEQSKHSAVLRGFLVYLAFIAGVLIIGENPAEQTQAQYVRLAGLISVMGFLVSYQPRIFGRILQRVSGTLAEPPAEHRPGTKR